MANDCPVILVHGILGFGPRELGGLSYWGSALRVLAPLSRHEASVGPLSSAHDRACEMAAQIMSVPSISGIPPFEGGGGVSGPAETSIPSRYVPVRRQPGFGFRPYRLGICGAPRGIGTAGKTPGVRLVLDFDRWVFVE